ncbi:MAG: hypothetical protein ACEPOW_08035 [Bacteroidales bacterium]
MTKLTSEKHTVNKSAEHVFQFLCDFNHFEPLMPDKVVDWKSDTESCSFNIQGMAAIGMKFVNKTANSRIEIESSGKNPFDFTLFVNINEKTAESCEVEMEMNADMNPMLAMMAKRPLSNLLKMMVEKLEELSF